MNKNQHQPSRPPFWADQFLTWFCAPHLIETILGDLHESHAHNVRQVGIVRARWRYWREVIGFMKPGYIKRQKSSADFHYHSNSLYNLDMLQNYFKIAYRNLIVSKGFSAINISGLALGLASAMLIFLWIQDELSMGRQYQNDRLNYRVMAREFTDGKVIAMDNTPGILADELKREFPEILYAAGFSSSESHLIGAGEKSGRHTGNFAGADWFKMYNLPLLAGKSDALDGPGSVAISTQLAVNYFGDPQRALGQSIRLDKKKDYQVTAVFDDLPDTVLDKYDFLLNWNDYLDREQWLKRWDNYSPATRIQVRTTPDGEPMNVSALNTKLTWFLNGRDTFGPTYHTNLFLRAEKDAYLYSGFKDGFQHGGRIEYVKLLGIIAVFLLLIAGINFMNLSTARSYKRAMEVGVRKAVGAGRGSLIGQFMTEAFLLTALALLIGLGLVILVVPAFNQLTGKRLFLPYNQLSFWLKVVVLLIMTALLAGSYPALFLSAFNPVKILKGRIMTGSGALLFRKGLVVFQFMLSMMMIVGTVIIYQQLQYFQKKNLGFDRENLISIPIEGDLSKNYSAFKQQLLQMSGIQSVTHSYSDLLGSNNTTESVTWAGKDPNASISFNNTAVDADFAKTVKLKFAEGRNFNPDFGGDSANYLINQAAAKRIGYTNPVGQPLTFWKMPGKIIGVVKDFHFNSLHEPITPLIIRLAEGHYGNILVRTQPGQTEQALKSIELTYKKLNSGFPFTYSFIDSGYEKLYKSENVVGVLASIFACLAIFIACLGLFGLAAFTAQQRKKEIGIRKVLGASIPGIIALLSQDFMKLVLIAIVMSSPAAWYVTEQWLQNFAYRIDVQWWVFAFAGFLSTAIALATISFQSIKAASTDPVKSLRSE